MQYHFWTRSKWWKIAHKAEQFVVIVYSDHTVESAMFWNDPRFTAFYILKDMKYLPKVNPKIQNRKEFTHGLFALHHYKLKIEEVMKNNVWPKQSNRRNKNAYDSLSDELIFHTIV